MGYIGSTVYDDREGPTALSTQSLNRCFNNSMYAILVRALQLRADELNIDIYHASLTVPPEKAVAPRESI